MSDEYISSGVEEEDFADETSLKLMKALQSVQVKGKRGRPPKKRKRPSPLCGKQPAAGSSRPPQVNQGEDVYSVFNELLNEIRAMRSDIADLKTNVRDLNTKLTAIEEVNAKLLDSNRNKDKKIAELESRVDTLEQHAKKGQVIVSSPAISSLGEENFQDVIRGMLASKLRLSQNVLDRFSIRRIGAEGKRRALVTTKTDEDRLSIFAAARTIKPTDFYINESLTRTRDQLYYDVRMHKKNTNGNYSVYTFHGNIFIRKDSNSKPVLIKTMDDLTKLR